MMDITFKLADANDVTALAEMMRELYEHERLMFDDAASVAALRQLLSDETLGQARLIRCEDQTIGYVVLAFSFSLEFMGRDAFVDELYIRENFRGRGIGKQTLKFVEAVCRARGVKALHLEVDRTNTDAQAVYQKSGFVDRHNYLLTKWLSD